MANSYQPRSESTDISYSKKMTDIAKGVGIFALLIHHSIANEPGQPIVLTASNLTTLLAASGKMCVSLFMILSGYGLTCSFRAKGQGMARFVGGHIYKIWSSYILIYVLVLLVWLACGTKPSSFYGTGPLAIVYMIKDMLGMSNLLIVTPTANGVWWYMEACFTSYMLFPLFMKIIDKGNSATIVLLIVSYLPWIWYFINAGWAWHTDREIYYFFSFILGMACARYGVFDRLVAYRHSHPVLMMSITFAALLLSIAIRSQLCLLADPLLALAVIAFTSCWLAGPAAVAAPLAALGVVSGDIFMFHTMVIHLLSEQMFGSSVVRLLVILGTCWAAAELLRLCKHITGYDAMMASLPRRLWKAS